ncbi:helix-turn-helix domain-containing protein [Salinicola acroporae]|nr:helix-turn-helix domain-containing protein [Salinicola acroporae]
MQLIPELNLSMLIDRAGGTNRVARECGLTSGAVSHWLRAGRLPDSDLKGETDYAVKLLALAGLTGEVDVWEVRLLGRRDTAPEKIGA